MGKGKKQPVVKVGKAAKGPAAANAGRSRGGGDAAAAAVVPNKRQERQERATQRKKREKDRFASHLTDAEDRQFVEQLRRLGCQIRSMVGDGNCLFRALADQLNGRQADHADIRSKVISYIEERRDFFENFMEDDETFDSYVHRMRRDAEWGGHQELFAAGQLFKVHVVVHQLRAPRFELRLEDAGGGGGGGGSVHLSYHGEQHYNSVRALGDDASASARPIILATAAAAAAAATSGSQKTGAAEQGGDSEAFALVSQSCPWVSEAEVAAALSRAGGDASEAVELLVSGVDVLAEDTEDTQDTKDTMTSASAVTAAAAAKDTSEAAAAASRAAGGSSPGGGGAAAGVGNSGCDGNGEEAAASAEGEDTTAVEEAEVPADDSGAAAAKAPASGRKKSSKVARYGSDAAANVARGAECPCGSGQRYKKCCRKKDIAAAAAAAAAGPGTDPTKASAAAAADLIDDFGALAI